MKIETKYEVGQKVFTSRFTKPHELTVASIQVYIVGKEHYWVEYFLYNDYIPVGLFDQEELFGSLGELKDFLSASLDKTFNNYKGKEE